LLPATVVQPFDVVSACVAAEWLLLVCTCYTICIAEQQQRHEADDVDRVLLGLFAG
jgi:hypothetical protein